MADERPTGAGKRRDQTMADAEAKALGGPPPAPSAPTAAPAPSTPSLMDRIKSAFGTSNPENKAGLSHPPGSRGM
jgi:hypothetical protein